MSTNNDILPEIQETNAKLRTILDEVSKMRVKCAQMQLDILSLYKPECLEILEMLKSLNKEQCVFNETPFEGNSRFLDISSDSDDLKEGTKFEFPIWLAHPLNTIQRPVVSIDLPKVYKENYREILEADACAVPLSKWNLYYYEVGMYLRNFSVRESDKITQSLVQTFKSRLRLIMDRAQNPVPDLFLDSQLTRLEKDLFSVSRKARVQLNEWLKNGIDIIETSEVATNLKKRKRAEYELS